MIVDICKGITEMYPGLREAFKMESFAIIVNKFSPLTIFVKFFILGVCVSPGYNSASGAI